MLNHAVFYGCAHANQRRLLEFSLPCLSQGHTSTSFLIGKLLHKKKLKKYHKNKPLTRSFKIVALTWTENVFFLPTNPARKFCVGKQPTNIFLRLALLKKDEDLENSKWLCINFHDRRKSGLPLILKTFEPLHDKTNKMTCAPSEGSDQPGHPHRLIRAFTVCSMGS